MISGAAIDHFTAAELYEHLGVSLGIDFSPADDRMVLTVRFANGDCESWIPAPDGYPLDGSREFIECRGRYFVPEVPR